MSLKKITYYIKLLIPRFDENSLFFISYSFILIFSFNKELRKAAIDFIFPTDDRYGGVALVFSLMFLGGLILSITHAFISKKKSYYENILMLFFGMFINGISGICAGIYLLKEPINLLVIFPFWNIFTGFISIYNIGLIQSTEQKIEESSWPQMLIGPIIIFTLFVICQFWQKLYWAVTFSICVAYSTSINSLFYKITKKYTNILS